MSEELLPSIDIDEDGYPTEESLEALRSYTFSPAAAARYLVENVPAIGDAMPIMSIGIEQHQTIIGHPAWLIEFHTGGWSGAEDLIDALLGQFWIRYYHTKWVVGGHYWFEVPHTAVALEKEAAG